MDWVVPSTANFSSVELTSGGEFDSVKRNFEATMPFANLINVTRYV